MRIKIQKQLEHNGTVGTVVAVLEGGRFAVQVDEVDGKKLLELRVAPANVEELRPASTHGDSLSLMQKVQPKFLWLPAQTL